MMLFKFLCYAVYDGDPDNEAPVDWCVVSLSSGKKWISVDLEDAKQQALDEYPLEDYPIEFVNGGWILSGEEDKLLNMDYTDVLNHKSILWEKY